MKHRTTVIQIRKPVFGSLGQLLLPSIPLLLALNASAQENSAQVGSAANSAQPPSVLEEIVVTARRRAENLQEAPVTVTALSQQHLENSGFSAFEDYAMTVPGLSFVGNNSPENKIVLRGVSTGVASRDEGAVVGVYIDDVPVGSRRFNPDLRLYDVERIEILRGPQGTLFGEGAIGGVLRMVPNKPDLEETSGSLQLGVADTRYGGVGYEAVGVANLPLSDRFGVRLVGYQVEDAGYVDNITPADPDKDADKRETSGGRVLVAAHPTETLELGASVLFQDSDADGKAQFDPELGNFRQQRNFQEKLGDEFTLVNLTAKLDFRGAMIESSTAWFDRTVNNLRDISPLVGGLPLNLDDLTKFESFVQEVRLSSSEPLLEGRLDWLVGVFYRDDEEFFRQDAFAAALGGDVFDSDNTLERKQISLFGEVDFKLTETLTATAGVRWFDIEQDGLNVNGGLLAGLPPGVEVVDVTDASEDGLSPKFQLSWQSTESVLLYALASRGFREGGPTGQGVPPDPATGASAPTQFDSDSLWNYELGLKTSWMDNRVTLNGAAFYIDWDDIQTNFVRADGHTFTVNAGAARSKGLELELRTLAAQNLELFATASFVDAELSEDQLPPGDGQSGDRIPAVPKTSFAAGLDYSRSLAANLQGFLNLHYRYVGSSFNGFASSTGVSAAIADKQPSYQLVNARFGIEHPRYRLTLFANNLFDKTAVLYFNRLVGDVRVNAEPPRTLGLQLRVMFP